MPSKSERPKIEQYYVAYFDILGYKAFFKDNPNEADILLDKVYDSIEETISNIILINEVIGRIGGNSNLFEYKTFSDNVLIYYKYNDAFSSNYVLLSFLEIVKNIQLNLILKHGLFLRGGITKGFFAANEKIIFGEALIRAVELESVIAKNPKIIIDSVIINELNTPISCLPSTSVGLLESLQESLNGLFVSDSFNELYNRIIKVITAYEEILIASLSSFYSNKENAERFLACLKSMRDLAILSKNGNSQDLEELYCLLKQSYSTILNLADVILKKQITNIEKYNEMRKKHSIHRSTDGSYFLDYLSIPDYRNMLKDFDANYANMIEQIKLTFSDRADLVESMCNILSADARADYQNIISTHKDNVLNQLNQYQNKPKILEKYLWAMLYHNDVCNRMGYQSFSIETSYLQYLL